jgi:hypothetical protein
MARKEKLLEDLNWITDKISSQIWILNLGTLGTTWSLLVVGTPANPVKITFIEARWIFLFCFSALMCEMAQHLSAYCMSKNILDRIEARGQNTFEFDPNSGWFKLRSCLFWAKIALTVIASLYLLVIIFLKLD